MRGLEKIFCIFYCVHSSFCFDDNWQSSLSTIHDLFDLETEHIIMTEAYIENEFKRLEDIKRFMEERTVQNAKEVAESYTESSLNAFKTIVRIKNDWETLKDKMVKTSEFGELKRGKVSKDNIVSGLNAIRRLQIIYELDVQNITNGEYLGFTFDKFNANDCYEMASLCFDNAEFHCAFEWYDEAYRKYIEENFPHTTDHLALITKYIWSSYLIGGVEKAKDIIRQFSNRYQLTETLTNLRYVIWAGHKVFKRDTTRDKDKRFYSHSLQHLDSNGEVSNFKAACQNTIIKPKLSCRYYHGGLKFLIIAPLREEDVSLKPKIKLFHDVLYDSEIEKIKKLAKTKLEVVTSNYNEDISLRRVAKFQKSDNEVFKIIDNRLAQMSFESKVNILDKYHVTNYGLGGHYLPHDDYVDDDYLIYSKGRRATIIFHMDDVPIGGATVLPKVNVHIPSNRGAALVIYNTRSFGEKNKLVQYGSCPIFYGDKWTLTTWFNNNRKPSPRQKHLQRESYGCRSRR